MEMEKPVLCPDLETIAESQKQKQTKKPILISDFSKFYVFFNKFY